MSCQRCTPTANDAEWPRCCYDTLHTLLPGPPTADHHHCDDGGGGAGAEKEGVEEQSPNLSKDDLIW